MAPARAFVLGCLLLCLAAFASAQNPCSCGSSTVDCTFVDSGTQQCTDCCAASPCSCPAESVAECGSLPDGFPQCTECCAVPECEDGFFRTGGACERCLSSCETCESADTCTKCKTGFFENPAGFSDEEAEGQCERCTVGCDTCTNGDECGDCRSGWSDVDSSNTCTQCPAGCAICSDNEGLECTACKSGRFLSEDNSCAFSCPDGQYETIDGESRGVCEDCTGGCETCSLVEDAVVCFTCGPATEGGPTTYLQDGACVSSCDDGLFEDDTAVCAPCPHACTKCDTRDVCTECEDNFALSGTSCVQNCGSDEWEDTTDTGAAVCEKCTGDCLTCGSSATDCLSCQNDKFYDPNATTDAGKCVDNCTGLTYGITVTVDSSDTKVCAPCNPRCTAGCTGPSRSECTVE